MPIMSTIGRAEELQRLRSHVLERRPTLVVGAPGTGRTRLLKELAEQLRADGTAHVLAHGADGEATVTLAPFARLVERYDDVLRVAEANLIDLYTRLPGAVARDGLVVLVDDVALLDRASQVLLAQLARAGVPLVATNADLDSVPRALLDDLTGPRGWVVEQLGPLADDAVLAMAAEHLGDQLSAPSAAVLLRYAGGNPLVVRELLAGAREASTTGPDGVRLGRLRATPRLHSLVGQRLERLDRVAREVLELIAVAGPMPANTLPPVAVEWLLHHAHLRPTTSPAPGALEAVEALVPPVLREGLSTDRTSALLLRGADAVADLAGWSDVEVRLRARAGEPVAAPRLVEAAQRAVAAGRTEDALELLGRLRGPDADAPLARLLLGAACSAEGSLEEADAHLRASLGTGDAPLRTRAAQELGLLLAVRAQRPAEAVARVEAVAAGIDDPSLRRILEGDLVKWRLMAGLPVTVLPGAPQPGDTDPDDAARVNDAVIGAMIASLDGAPSEARDLVETGISALARTDAVPVHTGDLLRLSAYLADAFDGRLAHAEEVAHEHRRRAAQVADPSLGMWEYATAELALHAGRLGDARVLVERAVRHLAWRDFTGLRPATAALRAVVESRDGDLGFAEQLAAALTEEQAADVKVGLHLARVHAQRHLVAGDPRSAGDVLAAAGVLAVEQSHRHLGLMALDDAVLADPASAADRAALLAEHVHPDAALGPVLLRRTQAVARGDAAALVEAAEDLARMGLPGRAATSLGLARSILERTGRGEAARKAHLRQLTLLADTGAVPWPGTSQPALLSPRELEVARLAAARLRSKEIAERCGLSVRTVDNHLARVYRKLGVTGRDDLPAALAALAGSVEGGPVAGVPLTPGAPSPSGGNPPG